MTRALAFALAALVFILDQWTKWYMIDVMRLNVRLQVEVLPFLNWTWVENRGISMGLLDLGDDGRWFLIALTGGIALGVAWWISRERSRFDLMALGLILGGALGNIVDRVRFGYVVDFVHLHAGPYSFYVFNVADAAITLGVVLLLARGLLARPAPAPPEEVKS
jgi:signal peptidase II